MNTHLGTTALVFVALTVTGPAMADSTWFCSVGLQNAPCSKAASDGSPRALGAIRIEVELARDASDEAARAQGAGGRDHPGGCLGYR